MLRFINFAGVGKSVSIDPIPESWEPQQQPQQQHQQEQHQQESAIVPLWSAAPAAATAAAPAAAIIDTSSSSIASKDWRPLPSIQCLLEDSGDEGTEVHTPAKATHRSSGPLRMVGESPPLQLTPTFSPSPTDEFLPFSGGKLQDALADPPLDASHHGITKGARPPKKQKGQGIGKGKGSTSPSDKKENGNSKGQDSNYKYKADSTVYT